MVSRLSKKPFEQVFVIDLERLTKLGLAPFQNQKTAKSAVERVPVPVLLVHDTNRLPLTHGLTSVGESAPLVPGIRSFGSVPRLCRHSLILCNPSMMQA